jgi:hypothetical protein
MRHGGRSYKLLFGTSADAVLAALVANSAQAAEIHAAMTQNEAGNPFSFESRDILGVGSGGPLWMMGQFARATFATLGRALRAKQQPSFAQMFADFQPLTQALEKTLCDRFSALGYSHQFWNTEGIFGRRFSQVPAQRSYDWWLLRERPRSFAQGAPYSRGCIR